MLKPGSTEGIGDKKEKGRENLKEDTEKRSKWRVYTKSNNGMELGLERIEKEREREREREGSMLRIWK